MAQDLVCDPTALPLAHAVGLTPAAMEISAADTVSDRRLELVFQQAGLALLYFGNAVRQQSPNPHLRP